MQEWSQYIQYSKEIKTVPFSHKAEKQRKRKLSWLYMKGELVKDT